MIATLLHRAVALPLVYDRVQRLAGSEKVGRFLAPHLAETAGATLLDAGAGTGNFRKFMPDSTRYIWLDRDPRKLSGYAAKHLPGAATLADATDLCFRGKSIDYGFCAAVSHHLEDAELARMFAELARVVRKRFIFFDAVRSGRAVSKVLWKYDRGSHPRTREQLERTLRQAFTIERAIELTIFHRYLLCIASPIR
jgi:SAM-dependent methyltransferase